MVLKEVRAINLLFFSRDKSVGAFLPDSRIEVLRCTVLLGFGV